MSILSAVYLLWLTGSSGSNEKDDIEQMEIAKKKKKQFPVYIQTVKQIFLKIFSLEELFQKRRFLVT